MPDHCWPGQKLRTGDAEGEPISETDLGLGGETSVVLFKYKCCSSSRNIIEDMTGNTTSNNLVFAHHHIFKFCQT